MKVTGQQPPRLGESTTSKTRDADAQPARARKAVQDAAAPGNARPTLTQSRVRESIRNTPDVRSDKVEAARARIQSGEYKVDAERLAQALLTESLRDDIEKP